MVHSKVIINFYVNYESQVHQKIIAFAVGMPKTAKGHFVYYCCLGIKHKWTSVFYSNVLYNALLAQSYTCSKIDFIKTII